MLDLGSIKRELKEDLRPRKVIRYALVPHFGGILTPMKDVFALLVRTIALLFVQSNLLPKDHPVMRGEVRGIGAIWLMIVDASANLKFTKQNIPQIAIFYAIVGMIVFSVLGTLTFMMKLSIGHARAQTYSADGLFTVSNTTDKAQTWISQLFPYNGTGAVNGIATALGTLLGYYNAAVLVLATFVALYTIMVMVLESAHDGEVGGKRHHEVYAIVRLIMAIGVLVPVSQGYNTAQILTIQLAKAGSALATNLWTKFDSQLVTAALPSSFAPGADMNQFLTVIHAIATCEAAAKVQPGITPSVGSPVADASPATKYTITYNYKAPNDGLCGSVTVPAVNTDLIPGADPQAWATTYLNFYNANVLYLTDITTASALIVPASSATAAGAIADADTTGTPLINWKDNVTLFQNTMNTEAQTIVGSYSSSGALSNLLAKINNDGWVDAGVIFIRISRIAGDIYNSENVDLSATGPDAVLQGEARFASSGSFLSRIGTGIARMGCMSKDSGGSGDYDDCSPAANATRTAIKTDNDLVQKAQAHDGLPQIDATGAKVSGSTSASADLIGTFTKAKLSAVAGALAIQIQTSAQNTTPSFGQSIVNVVSIGQYLIAVAAGLFIAAVAAGVIGAFGAGSGIVAIATLFGSILYPLAIILAVALPLLPAIRFFFGILTWLLTIFEALVALPLVAMYSIQGEGAGLWAHGKQGYLLVLQMMLRPTLMIFGLVAAVLMFDTIYNFISYSIYATWFNSTLSTSSSMFTTVPAYLSWIGFLLTYAFILYSVANVCFNMINQIPDRVLYWIGSQGINHMGDNDQAAQNALISTAGSMQQLGSSRFSGAIAQQNSDKLEGDRKRDADEAEKKRLAERKEDKAESAEQHGNMVALLGTSRLGQSEAARQSERSDDKQDRDDKHTDLVHLLGTSKVQTGGDGTDSGQNGVSPLVMPPPDAVSNATKTDEKGNSMKTVYPGSGKDPSGREGPSDNGGGGSEKYDPSKWRGK